MKIAVKIPLPCLSLTTNRDLHRGLAPVGFSQEQQAKGSLITLLMTGDSNLEFKFKGGPGSSGEVIWEVHLEVLSRIRRQKKAHDPRKPTPSLSIINYFLCA